MILIVFVLMLLVFFSTIALSSIALVFIKACTDYGERWNTGDLWICFILAMIAMIPLLIAVNLSEELVKK